MSDTLLKIADRSKDTANGTILIFVTLIGWSSVTLFLKYFTNYIDAWTANGWRYGIAASFWLPLLVARAATGRLPTGIWKAAVVPSLFNFAAQICFALAPYYINPGFITFLLRLQIGVLALGAYILFPAERAVVRSRAYAFGVMLVLAGLTALCFLGDQPPKGATAIGIALGLSAGVFYAGYSLGVRHFMNDTRATSAFAVISLYTASGILVLMLIFGADHGVRAWHLTWPQFAMLVVSSMVGIAITHVTYYAAIARIGVALAAGVILLQPFLTSTASYFIYDERLTFAQWSGGFTALAGGFLLLRAQRRQPKVE